MINVTLMHFHLEREGRSKAKTLKHLAIVVWSNRPRSGQGKGLEPDLDFGRVNDRGCYQWRQGHRSSHLLTINIIWFIHHYARNCKIVIYIACCSSSFFKTNGEFLRWAEVFCQKIPTWTYQHRNTWTGSDQRSILPIPLSLVKAGSEHQGKK